MNLLSTQNILVSSSRRISLRLACSLEAFGEFGKDGRPWPLRRRRTATS